MSHEKGKFPLETLRKNSSPPKEGAAGQSCDNRVQTHTSRKNQTPMLEELSLTKWRTPRQRGFARRDRRKKSGEGRMEEWKEKEKPKQGFPIVKKKVPKEVHRI